MAEEKSTESTDANQDINLQLLITDGKNARGIPCAKFIENVEEFLGDKSVEVALGALNELYSKYKYMENSFEKSKSIYKSKVPEIEQTIEILELLLQKKENGEETFTNYNLCDTVFAKAKVDATQGKCGLWIGANTMVEYTYDEALDLLRSQLKQTHLKLEELNEDLKDLRANSITLEVNMARLFNHSVKLKKLREAAEQGAQTAN